MGVMNFLRERMGKIVAIVIGGSLLAFILGEVLRSGSSFMRGDRDELGEVAGEKISYQSFQKQFDQMKQQSGQVNTNGQFTAYLQEMTWNQQVSQVVLNREIDKLGLVVSGDEKNAMVNGNDPDPQIVQYFGDPKTGKVDQAKFNNFKANLATAKADDPMKVQWYQFIDQLATNKLAQKYIAATTDGLYVNSLDVKDDYENKNKLANFKYVTLDYGSIPDNKVTLTDNDYQSYYDEHKSEFKSKEETRSIDFVTFNAAPSKEDSAAIKDQIEKLVPALKSSTNDSLFIQINAETKTPLAFKRKGQLGDPKLDSVVFNQGNGFVYGPYISAGSYKIAKVVEAKTVFDSVKTRHILIDPKKEGSIAKATAKADSIKKLIQGGRSFTELAATLSADPGSAQKGGDIPSFDYNGSMGPAGGGGTIAAEYTKASFDAHKGDLVVVTSPFGVHLIQVMDQKGSSKVVKLAVVDKPIAPSSKTQTIAYSAAQRFLGSLSKGNFDAEAKKEKLTKKSANDIQPLAASFPGADDARPIVRWAFKAEKGDFGDQVFTSGDQYIVPVLTEIKPKGTLPLDVVKKQIEAAVRNHVKAKMLLDKFQAAEAGASTIDQVAQKVSASAVPVQNIVFANPVIPGLSLEYKVIGAVFGSKPGKLSKPIEGQHGVYVFALDNFTNPAPLANAVREREQMLQSFTQRSQSVLFDALKDKANVKDYRSKFL